jgi:hypothetical protein
MNFTATKDTRMANMKKTKSRNQLIGFIPEEKNDSPKD